MLMNPERLLLIQIISNVDDILNGMIEDQKRNLASSIRRVYANYYNLLEGVPEDSKGVNQGADHDEKKG